MREWVDFKCHWKKSLLFIQNVAAVERIIEMLNILGPNIFLTFHYYVLTGPQTDILGKMCQICVLNKGEQSNCVMLPLGNQDLASSNPWSDYFMPRGHLALVKLSSCRTGLADLIFI